MLQDTDGDGERMDHRNRLHQDAEHTGSCSKEGQAQEMAELTPAARILPRVSMPTIVFYAVSSSSGMRVLSFLNAYFCEQGAVKVIDPDDTILIST